MEVYGGKKPRTSLVEQLAFGAAKKICQKSRVLARSRLIKMQRENNERIRYLNQILTGQRENEEKALRVAVRKLYPKKEAEIDLALNTGLRWGEQYRLRWSNVDLTRNVIKIIRPKGGRDERVPINLEARHALLKLKALTPEAELVCPTTSYEGHHCWWTEVLEAAAINDFHWHDLRHTFASRLVMNGVDIYTVNRLMRHRTIQMRARYAHLADKHLAAAVGKLVGSVTPGDTADNELTAEPPAQNTYVQ